MKALFPFASFLTAFPVMAADSLRAPMSPEKEKPSSRLSATVSDECLLLANKGCGGSRKQIQYVTSSGYKISVESINDDASQMSIFNQTIADETIGTVQGKASWSQKVKGAVLRLGKAFHPTQNSTFEAELYAGRISGEVDVTAEAKASLTARSIIIPAIAYNGYRLNGMTFYPANSGSLNADMTPLHYRAVGKTYLGGLRQHFGTSYKTSERTHILFNQFAQAGVEKISYGAGLGFAYVSGPDDRLGAKLAGICQRGFAPSNAKFSFAVSACTEKIERDVRFDKMFENGGQWSGRINDYIAGGQAVINQVNQRMGTNYTVATTTPDQMMQALGINSPYNRLNTSFVMAASMNVAGVNVALIRHQPIKSSRDGDATTSLTFGKGF